MLDLHHDTGVVVVNAPPDVVYSGQLDNAFGEGAGADVILAASGVDIGSLVTNGRHGTVAVFGEDSPGKYSLVEDASTAGTCKQRFPMPCPTLAPPNASRLRAAAAFPRHVRCVAVRRRHAGRRGRAALRAGRPAGKW